MLNHLHLLCFVIKAFLVALTLSGSGCNAVATPDAVASARAAIVITDGPETVGVKPADVNSDAKSAACQCGPDCKCKTTPNNPACACDKCVCDPKPETFVPVPDPIGEGVEGPGGFTGQLCIMDNGPCPHCVSQTATVAAMPAWKERIRIVHDGEQQAYGIGEVYGFPCWVTFIEGRAVRMHTGYLTANEIADFNANQAFGTTAMKSRPVRRTFSYCPSCQ